MSWKHSEMAADDGPARRPARSPPCRTRDAGDNKCRYYANKYIRKDITGISRAIDGLVSHLPTCK
jgi:hypothetical protein